MSFVIASYAIAGGGALLYGLHLLRSRRALRKALIDRRNRDGS